MSMLTLKLGEISANIASRRLEEAEKKYRLEKLLMTDEERAEAERREKKHMTRYGLELREEKP